MVTALLRQWLRLVACVAFAIIAVIGSVQGAQAQPPGRVGGASGLDALSTTSLSTRLDTAPDVTALGGGDLVYHGGPILYNPTAYLTFWGDAWATNGSAHPYTTEVINYFNVMKGTLFANILTQYHDSSGHYVSSTPTLGGYVNDPAAPPTDTACGTNTVEDVAVRTEVGQMRALHGWTGTTNATYFVYLPPGYVVRDDTGACSNAAYPNGLCGYHSSIGTTFSSFYTYASIVYPDGSNSCEAAGDDQFGGGLIESSMHEQFEAITDPFVGAGWIDAYASKPHEIADKCKVEEDSFFIDTHVYYGWPMYSNRDHACVVANPTPPSQTWSGVQATGLTDVFLQDSNHGLQHRWLDGYCANDYVPSECWNEPGWVALGASAVSEPAMARNANGRLQYFVRNTGNELSTAVQSCPGCSGWGPFWILTDSITGDPAAGVNPDGHLEVFAKGPDGHLGHSYQTCVNCTSWSSWISFGGPTLAGRPAVARHSDGHLEVFVRNTAGELWHIWQCTGTNCSGGWSVWQKLATGLADDPAVGVDTDGRVEVFARRTDNAVGHMYQQNCSGCPTWSTWQSMGSAIRGVPAVARNLDGRLEVFVNGIDSNGVENSLLHAWQGAPGSSWSGWGPLSSTVFGDISVAQTYDGRLQVVVREYHGGVYTVAQTCPGCNWAPWWSLGSI